MSLQDLLNRDRSVTIHHRHIQKLGIEVCKATNNLSPILIQEIFPERNYNGPDLRHQTDFEIPMLTVSTMAKRH